MNIEKASSDPVDTQTGPSVAVQASVDLSAPTLPKGVTPTITATGDEKVADNKPQDKSDISTPPAIMQVG